MVVVDSTDRDRLATTREELFRMLAHEVRRGGGRRGPVLTRRRFARGCAQDLRNATVLIYANKQDVKGAMPAAEISQKLNLNTIKDRSWYIQACCALTGEGLPQGMDWLTQQVKAKR